MSIRALSCRALFLVLALVAAKPASAISIVEPLAFGTWRDSPDMNTLGAGAAIGIASIDVVPTFEYDAWEDHGQVWAVNVDAHFPILALPVVAFYIGGGVTTFVSDPDGGEADTDTGISALIGSKASVGRLKPFGELKWTTAGPSDFVATLGLRFHLFD